MKTEGDILKLSCGENELPSCSIANKKPECLEGAQADVSGCHPAEKLSNLLSGQCQNASIEDQGRGKEINLGQIAHQVEENQNDRHDRNEVAIQTHLISKLPVVRGWKAKIPPPRHWSPTNNLSLPFRSPNPLPSLRGFSNFLSASSSSRDAAAAMLDPPTPRVLRSCGGGVMGEESAMARETGNGRIPQKSPYLKPPPAEVNNPEQKAAAAAAPTTNIDERICAHLAPFKNDFPRFISGVRSASKCAPRCAHYLCENKVEKGSILVCIYCMLHFCIGDGTKDKPQGHARWHANLEQHCVGALLSDPGTLYCFLCECTLHLDVSNMQQRQHVSCDKEEISCSSSRNVRKCTHACDKDDVATIVQLIESTVDAPMCDEEMCQITDGHNMMMCLECNWYYCIGGPANKANPQGHIRQHAFLEWHWFALWYDDPYAGYCFACEDSVIIGGKESKEGLTVNGKANCHAPGSANGDDCVIREILNPGNTCYMNALLRCLLVLGKLQARMFGPDVPLGILGTILRGLFVDTNSASHARGLLNPKLLLACVRRFDSWFIGTSMQDSHELLCCLRDKLNEEEKIIRPPKMKKVASTSVAPRSTIIDSIFGGQLSVTTSCKCCLLKSYSCDVFYDLSVPLPPKGTPSKRVPASPPQNKVTSEDKGKTQSHDIVNDEAEDINSLASIEECLELHMKAEIKEWTCENCSKVAQKASTTSGKDGEQMISTNVNRTLDGDQAEQSDCETCQSEQSSNLIRLAVECSSSTSQPHGSDVQHQVIPAVDIKTNGDTSGISCVEKNLSSCSIADKKSECFEGVQEDVSSCRLAEKQDNLLSRQYKNISIQDQGRRKQVNLGHNARQVEENQDDWQDRNESAIQTRLISKLPPVLVIQLKRSLGPLEVSEHVSFKEILDVEPFMDPSSEDKISSGYRLVGVVEHRGLGNDIGNCVAYVRANHQQRGSGSSSWFCATEFDVNEISLEEVLKCKAYLLFYERMEG
uniref:Ubiquitinyl hydrolase 1 n=1 Tax=Leersia perrieri TaxID=77586 RepID=A0A0D9XA12_9ORYZ